MESTLDIPLFRTAPVLVAMVQPEQNTQPEVADDDIAHTRCLM